MKALITGASGFVGAKLCEELTNNGYQVRALVRGTSIRTKIPPQVELITGDLSDKDSLVVACAGVDTVFHCAALYREAKFADSEYWRVNFEGTQNILEAAKAAGVKRFLHTSTTGVMGSITNPPANEVHPYYPGDVYQESKTEAEKLVLSWIKEGKISATIIRPTMIWGPGDTRLFKMYRGIAKRRFPLIGDGKTLNHYVLCDDLVRGFRLAVESPRAAGELYIVGGERYVTLRYTMEVIAKCLGVSLLPFRIPVTPLLIAGDIVETLCKPFGVEPPLHRRRVEFFIKSRAFDCTKAKEHFGYSAQRTFEDEVAYNVAWYRKNNWL